MKHYRGVEDEVLFTHTTPRPHFMKKTEAHALASPAQHSLSFDPLKVSGPGLRRSGTRDGQVRVPQKRVRVPPSCQEAKGRLPERHPVHVEVWQDGGHVLPHPRLRRLGSR